MKHYLLDFKLSILTGAYFALTATDLDYIMKIIVFILTVGYTIRRWHLLEKQIRKNNKNNDL